MGDYYLGIQNGPLQTMEISGTNDHSPWDITYNNSDSDDNKLSSNNILISIILL